MYYNNMFNSILLLNKYSAGDINIWKKTNVFCLYVNINNNIATFKYINNNYIDRMMCIKKLINEVLEIYKIPDMEILINVMDNPINNPYFLHFSRTSSCKVNTIPNFSFYEWKDAKSDDFFETKNKIMKVDIEWEKKENKIFWSGINSSSIREKFAKIDSDIYIFNLIKSYSIKHTYYSLEDHCKYKYLLDLEGKGYSGRFPYLALTGSCIIILENENENRDYKMYYDEFFIENIHYLKVKFNDDENINSIHIKILNKIKDHDCQSIGINCKRVANIVFTKQNILLYTAKVLNYYSNLYVNDSIKYNTDIIYNRSVINKIKNILRKYNN